jgi:toxin ParE1/3/4
MRVEISERAGRDLEAILRRGIAERGALAAVLYYNRLMASFDWIANHPRAARERLEHGLGIRFHFQGSHRVVYRLQNDDRILIVRVLHGRQEVKRHL